MSSFFTKRKRADTGAAPSAKRGKTSKSRKDEEISSSNSEDETLRKRASDEEIESESSSEDEDETTQADRRRKLAERYLENIKGEVDEIGFDAEDVDRDLIAERLQEDVVRRTISYQLPSLDTNFIDRPKPKAACTDRLPPPSPSLRLRQPNSAQTPSALPPSPHAIRTPTLSPKT